ncbi:MAG: hypothetical protein AAGE52_18055 [Myxococcota bacterium]
MSERYIDKHDVHAFCARAKEIVDRAEERAMKAVSPGWILERREYADHATAMLAQAKHTLDELERCLQHTLKMDEQAQEQEAKMLLGDADPEL